jgi:hypothetical protein
MFKIRAMLILVVLFIYGCPSPSAKYKELRLGETVITYTSQECHPSIKWDGFRVLIENLEFPDLQTNPLNFSVQKIEFGEQAVRKIQSTIFYYDGMLMSTCQTLVRLKEEDSIILYSKHRDKTLERLANYLSSLEKAESDQQVKDISKSAVDEQKKEEDNFLKKTN